MINGKLLNKYTLSQSFLYQYRLAENLVRQATGAGSEERFRTWPPGLTLDIKAPIC